MKDVPQTLLKGDQEIESQSLPDALPAAPQHLQNWRVRVAA
jgi:hypothetical protein